MNALLATSSIPLGNLEAYIGGVHQTPLLTAEEELHLAKRLHDHGDVEAARKLVLAHLRYVVRVARGYLGYGLALGDLIQEGNLGLMKAVKRFDPNVGVRLVSFAVHWIKAEIHEFVLRNWRIVKIATTKAQRKLFFNLRKMKKRLGWFTCEEVESVASDLGVSQAEVLRMEQRLNAMDAPYDGYPTNSEEAFKVPMNYLENKTSDPALKVEKEDTTQYNTRNLTKALAILDERSRDIIKQRWLGHKKRTLHDLAEKYHISLERIRQLEKTAMKKLEGFLLAA